MKYVDAFRQGDVARGLAARIAEAIGGQVIAIDPLAPDYLTNLREVARRIAAAGKSVSP